MKKLTFETQEKDYVTGELKKESKTYKIDQQEDYIKLYINAIGNLNDLKSTDILFSLLSYVTYNNRIIINSSIKRIIAENTSKKFATVNQYISLLVKKEILIREDTGVYILNPYMFGKGEWKDIIELRNSIELKITFSDKEIKAKTKIL